MPIGKVNQFLLELNNDEIDSHEIRHMKIEEDAGLGLPTIFLEFMTEDEEKVKRYNNPGYVLNVGMGRNTIEYRSVFRTFTTEITMSYGGDRWIVRMYGVLSNYEYLTKQRMESYRNTGDKKKSSEVWEEVMKRTSLTPITSPSNDKMLWLQHNLTDRLFLEEVIWHGYWKDDDPALTGIRRNGEAVYKPLSQLMKRKGTIGDSDSVDIKTNNFSGSQDEGFLSSWAGHHRRVPFHTMEGGEDMINKGETKPKVSNKSGLIPDITKTQEIDRINDNVHKNWWVARRQNTQFKSSLSSTSLTFTCFEYHPIFLLDMYEVQWKRQTGTQDPLTPYNGLWLTTNVVISATANSLQLYAKLNRETFI